MTQRENLVRECVRLLFEREAQKPGGEDLRRQLDCPQQREELLARHSKLMLQMFETEAAKHNMEPDRPIQCLLRSLSSAEETADSVTKK